MFNELFWAHIWYLVDTSWLARADAGCQLAEFCVGMGVGSQCCANLALLGRKFSTCSIVVICTKNTTFCYSTSLRFITILRWLQHVLRYQPTFCTILPARVYCWKAGLEKIHTHQWSYSLVVLSFNLSFKLHFYWLGFLMDWPLGVVTAVGLRVKTCWPLSLCNALMNSTYKQAQVTFACIYYSKVHNKIILRSPSSSYEVQANASYQASVHTRHPSITLGASNSLRVLTD